MIQDKKEQWICFVPFLSQRFHHLPHAFSLSPNTPPLCYPIFALQHLGGALPASGGGRGGPAGLGLVVVGDGGLRGRRGRRVPSLASLLQVALVPGRLGEHLHPAVLVLLQASPEVCTLPVSLQLPEGGGEEKKKTGMQREKQRRRNEHLEKQFRQAEVPTGLGEKN